MQNDGEVKWSKEMEKECQWKRKIKKYMHVIQKSIRLWKTQLLPCWLDKGNSVLDIVLQPETDSHGRSMATETIIRDLVVRISQPSKVLLEACKERVNG